MTQLVNQVRTSLMAPAPTHRYRVFFPKLGLIDFMSKTASYPSLNFDRYALKHQGENFYALSQAQNGGTLNLSFDEGISAVVMSAIIVSKLGTYNHMTGIHYYTFEDAENCTLQTYDLSGKIVVNEVEFHECFIYGYGGYELSASSTTVNATRSVSISYDYFTEKQAVEELIPDEALLILKRINQYTSQALSIAKSVVGSFQFLKGLM